MLTADARQTDVREQLESASLRVAKTLTALAIPLECLPPSPRFPLHRERARQLREAARQLRALTCSNAPQDQVLASLFTSIVLAQRTIALIQQVSGPSVIRRSSSVLARTLDSRIGRQPRPVDPGTRLYKELRTLRRHIDALVRPTVASSTLWDATLGATVDTIARARARLAFLRPR